MLELDDKDSVGEASVEEDLKHRKHFFFYAHITTVIRFLGLVMVFTVAVIYNHILGDPPSLARIGLYLLLVLGYTALTWLLLALYYRKHEHSLVHSAIFVLDLPIFLFTVYETGADQSWFFMILLIRVADQIHMGPKHTLFFAHAGPLSYLGFLFYLTLVEGRDLAWSMELGKTLALFAAGLYLSFTAIPAKRAKERAAKSHQHVKDLAEQLSDQALELRDARMRAEESSRIKGELMANMSHEIRTPIHGVLGMNALLLDSGLDEKQKEYAETVNLCAESLLEIINDILDIAKLESGKMELESVDFDLGEILDVIQVILAPKAEEKGLPLRIAIDSTVPRALNGDPLRLRQLLLNVVGNAIKFTEKGEVAVTCGAQPPDASGRIRISFRIRDTGVGIPTEKLEDIFDSFSQADGSTTRRFGGTGLGLAITKQLIDMMAGEIRVESQVGIGSTFTLEIPLSLAAPSSATDPTRASKPST